MALAKKKISRVDYAGETLIDLTYDTVAPNNLVGGITAHDSAGNGITGELEFAAVATSGDYNDLSNKPTVVTGDKDYKIVISSNAPITDNSNVITFVTG